MFKINENIFLIEYWVKKILKKHLRGKKKGIFMRIEYYTIIIRTKKKWILHIVIVCFYQVIATNVCILIWKVCFYHEISKLL